MYDKVMGRTRTGFTKVYVFDLVIVCETSYCHDDHLCQICFKSHLVGLRYVSDTILEHSNENRERETERQRDREKG